MSKKISCMKSIKREFDRVHKILTSKRRDYMTVEYQLTKKKYYETFMQENENQPPVKVLGHAYYEEQQKSGTTYRSFA